MKAIEREIVDFNVRCEFFKAATILGFFYLSMIAIGVFFDSTRLAFGGAGMLFAWLERFHKDFIR